jgi:hypothetical protein
MPGGSAESYKNGQDSQCPSHTENEHQMKKPEAGNLQGRFFWSGVKKHCSPTAILMLTAATVSKNSPQLLVLIL